MPTSQENISKWCSNCDLQDYKPKVGVVCSLTKERANFTDECPSFSLDMEQAKANDSGYIHNKHESGFTSVRPTKKNFWRSFFPPKLNKEIKIRESHLSQLLPGLLIVLTTFPIGSIIIEGITTITLLSLIGCLVLIVLLFVFDNMQRGKGKTILILSKDGIQLDNKTSYKWDEIQTFIKRKPRWQFWLIIKKPLENERLIALDSGKVSISKLEDLIERYKEL